jgi:hypothetical protein
MEHVAASDEGSFALHLIGLFTHRVPVFFVVGFDAATRLAVSTFPPVVQASRAQ